jgi:hypothetical protein
MASTGAKPQDIASAMQEIASTGRVPRFLAEHPEQAKKLSALSRLVFDVEPGRGLAASVVLPTNLNLLRNGHITPEQAFVSLNQMSPLGAVKTAHGADQSLGFERKLQHKDPATSQSINPMLSVEREALSHWLLSRSKGENQIFDSRKDLIQLLNGHQRGKNGKPATGDLHDYLMREVNEFFGYKG